MPLDDTFDDSIYFIGRYEDVNEPATFKIGGTAFAVGVPSEVHPDRLCGFIVTAGHVISHSPRVVVRGPSHDGAPQDIVVEDWITHPQFDVSVAPMPAEWFDFRYIPLDRFVDAPDAATLDEHWDREYRLWRGDRVYFLGLLTKVDEIAEARIPIARSGTIARSWLHNFPVEDQWGQVAPATVHLIDCTSFGGFSGSPCFVEESRAYIRRRPEDGGLQVGTTYRIALLGLIGGHVNEWVPTRINYLDPPADEERQEGLTNQSEGHQQVGRRLQFEAAVNRGLAHVIPAEHIRETLNLDEALEYRAACDDAHSGTV